MTLLEFFEQRAMVSGEPASARIFLPVALICQGRCDNGLHRIQGDLGSVERGQRYSVMAGN